MQEKLYPEFFSSILEKNFNRIMSSVIIVLLHILHILGKSRGLKFLILIFQKLTP